MVFLSGIFESTCLSGIGMGFEWILNWLFE